jgi:catechol-2,3-dioxygenase
VKVSSLSHYNLRAPRELLDELRAFYVEVVGLEVGHRPAFTNFGYWLYAGEQAVLHLGEASDDEARVPGAAGTFDHAAFNCVGRKQFEARLARLGVGYEVAQVPQTGQVQLFFDDPAGNGVELSFTGADT